MNNLGAIVQSTSTLFPDQVYTFTYDQGKFFEMNSDSWVLSELRRELSRDLNIMLVARPLFSSRYIVTFSPKKKVKYSYLLDIFKDAWLVAGYPNAALIQAETGKKSSVPGGLVEVGKKVGDTTKEISSDLLKPIIPTLIFIGGAYFIYKFWWSKRK